MFGKNSDQKNKSGMAYYQQTYDIKYDLKPKPLTPFVVELVHPYSEKVLSGIFNTTELISKLFDMSILDTIDHVIFNANIKTDSDKKLKLL